MADWQQCRSWIDPVFLSPLISVFAVSSGFSIWTDTLYVTFISKYSVVLIYRLVFYGLFNGVKYFQPSMCVFVDLYSFDVMTFQCFVPKSLCHVLTWSHFKYSRLSLSRIPRDSLKHFEISVPRHIRVERVRKTINWTTFNKWICNLTPEVKNIYI